MGTSVLQCPQCRKYYGEYFKDKRRMKFLARYHKAHGNSGKNSA